MATPSPNPPMKPLPEETPPLPSSPPPESEIQDQGHPAEEEGEDGKKRREEAKLNEQWLQEMQGSLLVLATVVASVTYSAGLNVPGGFWQDDSPARNASKSHAAGDPVLADKKPFLYKLFFSCNESAFMSSIVVIMLLLKRSYFRSEFGLRLLLVSLIGCLFNLVVAFCAASTRNDDDARRVFITFASTFVWISFLFWASKWLLKKKSSTTRPTSSRGTNV